MTISWVAVTVMVIGALIFAFASNPKLAELGRLLFFAGVLALVLVFASHHHFG